MRLAPLLAVLALAVAGCGGAPAVPDESPGAAPALLRLAETTRRAGRTLDAARYRAERGAAMRSALDLSREALDDVRAAAAELAHAVDPDDDREPARLLRQAVVAALDGSDDSEQELDVLRPLVEADDVMERAVATWRDRADAGVGEQVAALTAGLAPSPVLPPPCRTLWDNRERWATLVAARTQQLARPEVEEADRQAFLAEPFGEDRRTADAADRPCWREHGAMPRALATLRRIVAAYDEATRR